MLGVISAYWLFALILIPIIWWLHRHHPLGQRVVVSSLLYWQHSSNDRQEKQQGKRSNPLWILRALIILLIVLSLAGLFWSKNQVQKINVWVDDSFSLQTQEQGTTRKDLLIQSLVEKLKKTDNVQLEVHSLTQDEKPVLKLTSNNQLNWKAEISAWYSSISAPSSKLPLAIDFTTEAEHWLVSDSANSVLNEWAQQMPFSQFVLAGKNTENSAISLLSIRPSLKNKQFWSGLIQLQHFGEQETQREVQLRMGDKLIKQWYVELVPFQLKNLAFNLELSTSDKKLSAHFVQADNLIKDDELSLAINPAKKVQLIGLCPAALLAAIHAHPALTIIKSSSDTSDLSIICAEKAIETEGPSIQFYLTNDAKRVIEKPVWQPIAELLNQLYLPIKGLKNTSQGVAQINTQPVLIVGQDVLIDLTQQQARRVDCYIDITDIYFTNSPEYPVFIAGLVDLALNTALLNNIQTVKRDAKQSQIKPLSVMHPQQEPIKAEATEITDLSSFLIFIALLLLLFDFWLVMYALPARKD